MSIEVHQLSDNPNKAWKKISQEIKVSKIEIVQPGPRKPNHIRIVCISDTHNRTDFIDFPIPDGDLLIHGGDFTFQGQRREVLVIMIKFH